MSQKEIKNTEKFSEKAKMAEGMKDLIKRTDHGKFVVFDVYGNVLIFSNLEDAEKYVKTKKRYDCEKANLESRQLFEWVKERL